MYGGYNSYGGNMGYNQESDPYSDPVPEKDLRNFENRKQYRSCEEISSSRPIIEIGMGNLSFTDGIINLVSERIGVEEAKVGSLFLSSDISYNNKTDEECQNAKTLEQKKDVLVFTDPKKCDVGSLSFGNDKSTCLQPNPPNTAFFICPMKENEGPQTSDILLDFVSRMSEYGVNRIILGLVTFEVEKDFKKPHPETVVLHGEKNYGFRDSHYELTSKYFLRGIWKMGSEEKAKIGYIPSGSFGNEDKVTNYPIAFYEYVLKVPDERKEKKEFIIQKNNLSNQNDEGALFRGCFKMAYIITETANFPDEDYYFHVSECSGDVIDLFSNIAKDLIQSSSSTATGTTKEEKKRKREEKEEDEEEEKEGETDLEPVKKKRKMD